MIKVFISFTLFWPALARFFVCLFVFCFVFVFVFVFLFCFVLFCFVLFNLFFLPEPRGRPIQVCNIKVLINWFTKIEVQNLYKDQFWNQPLIKTSIRDGTVVGTFASHQCGPGSILLGLSLLLLFLFRAFFSRFSGFPHSTKTSISKF